MLLKKSIANAISIFKCNNHNREMSDKRKLIRKKKPQALVDKAGTIADKKTKHYKDQACFVSIKSRRSNLITAQRSKIQQRRINPAVFNKQFFIF